MPDTKLRPTSTMKNKDKSSELRVGDVNATNRNSYLNIIFIKLVTQYVKKNLLKTKIRTFEVIRFQNTLKCLSFFKTHFYSPGFHCKYRTHDICSICLAVPDRLSVHQHRDFSPLQWRT